MHDADHFRKLAAKYRALAEESDPSARSTLMQLVHAYEHEAEKRAAGGPGTPPVIEEATPEGE